MNTQLQIKTEENVRACAFTGHREIDEHFSVEKLNIQIETLIKNGVDTFYNGGAVGFDLIAAKQILAFKEKYPHIKLVVCVPYYGQEKYYAQEEKKAYANVCKNADEVVVLSEHYYKGCFLKRNDYLCERADALLAYQHSEKGGTAYTVKKFKKTGGKIILL